jgi:hypothetical protein
MKEFNNMINKIKVMVEVAANYIEDHPEVEEFLAEGGFNPEYPWVAVIDYLGEVKSND